MGAALSISPTLPCDDAPPRWQWGWIIDRRHDLLWFIGGALTGYGMFFLHAGLELNMLTVWFFWYTFLDVPHFFGTYARTYLDKEELARRPLLYWGSLGLLLVGPSLILLSYGLYSAGSPLYALPYYVLIAFVSLWAYWHVVRQHYGIMALYKRKSQDVAAVDQWVDKSFLYVGLLAPFFAFAVRHPEGRYTLGFPAAMPAFSWTALTWEHWVIVGSIVAVALTGLAFLFRTLYRWQTGLPVNMPKTLFLLAVVPLHCLVCYHSATFTTGLLSFTAFVTIFHDVQYHAIVWHYQQNRYQRPGVDPKRFGLAVLVSRHFSIYMTCAVLMGVGAGLLGCALGIEPGCIPIFPQGGMTLFGQIRMQDLFFTFALGFIMHHYFVDQFIWRPSRDRDLRRDLNMNNP